MKPRQHNKFRAELILPGAILVSVLLCENVCLAGDYSGMFDDLDKGLIEKRDKGEDDARLAQRALYSVNFDRWLKHYMDGKDADAEKEWAKILAHAKGISDLRTLFRSANSRLIFLEGKEHVRCLARGNLLFADNKMLAASEKYLGKNHILIATAYQYMSNCYGDVYDWKNAADYSVKCFKIRELNWGRDNARLASDLQVTTKKLYKAGRYKDSLEFGQRMVAMGERYGHPEYSSQGKTIAALSKRKLESPLKNSVKKPSRSPG